MWYGATNNGWCRAFYNKSRTWKKKYWNIEQLDENEVLVCWCNFFFCLVILFLFLFLSATIPTTYTQNVIRYGNDNGFEFMPTKKNRVNDCTYVHI